MQTRKANTVKKGSWLDPAMYPKCKYLKWVDDMPKCFAIGSFELGDMICEQYGKTVTCGQEKN